MEEAAFRRFHRQIVVFAIIDLLIISLVIAQPVIDYIPSLVISASLIITLIIVVIIANGFYSRSEPYLDRMVNMNEIMKILFLMIGIIHLIVGISSGEFALLIQAALLVALSVVKRRNITQMKHPLYLKWYTSGAGEKQILSEGEVFATCPSCQSLLAVIPSMLSPSDRCPNCEGLLVTSIEEE